MSVKPICNKEALLSFVLELLESLPALGKTTTIVIKTGFVFEFKGIFPHGKYEGKYYNLNANGAGLEGHLPLQSITSIEFQEKEHFGRMAYAFCFLDKNGDAAFKVFLGRQNNGEIIASQLEVFQQLKQRYVAILST